jgi:hypothetical protein
MVITMIIAMAISGVISCRAPITTVIRRPVRVWSHPAYTHSIGKAPAGIWIIMNTITVGDRSWIVVCPIPWGIIITCSIDNYTTIGVRVGISGCITDIYNSG